MKVSIQGSLASILNMMSDCNLNLTKIQSLPVIKTPGKYAFFVDITFDSIDNYQKAIKIIELMAQEFKILGEYIGIAFQIKDDLFDTPPVFKLIQSESNTNWREMYQVFNMGHRMELYVEPSAAEDIVNISNKFSVDAKIIGHVESSKNKKLTLDTHYGTLTY